MARRPLLEFEKPLIELEQQIEQIRQLARDSEVDVSQQLLQLETLAARRREEIFQNLTPAQKIQVARHPHRPSTLDFIQMFCDDWVELHGDRRGSDDQALVGGLGRLGDRSVVLLGHQKGRDTKENVARNFGMATPGGYRKALRLMEHADRFGLPIENVSIVHGDTDKVQFGMGTYGSRSGPVGMTAVVKAMDKVEAKVKKIAAHALEASEDDIVIEGGEVKVTGTDKSMAWHEVGLAAYIAHNLPEGMEPGLKETAFFDPVNFSFPSGAFICEVEVDPDTGHTEIVQFTSADDFGTIINPMVVEGQVHGGVAQGIGQAMLEHVIYDEAGQLLTGSYMDYTMPRAADLPFYDVSHHSTPSPNNPLGIKGCGEAGAIGAPPAVINAITDAIGSNDLEMPATPQAVWRAIQANSSPLAAE